MLKIFEYLKLLWKFISTNYHIIIIICSILMLIYLLFNFTFIVKSIRVITNLASKQCEEENNYFNSKIENSDSSQDESPNPKSEAKAGDEDFESRF